MLREEIKSSGVNFSIIPSAKTNPPLGPPVSASLISTLNGKLNLRSIITPMIADPSSLADNFICLVSSST